MRILFLLAAVASVLSFTACKKKAALTTNGFEIINHTNAKGDKAKAGEMIKFHVYTYVHDSLVSSSRRDRGDAIETILPDSTQMQGQRPVPVLDALLMMAAGDSVSVYQTVDSIMAKGIPPSLGKVDKVRFDVVLVERLSKEEVEKKQAEAKNKAEGEMARGKEVAAMVAQTLADYKAKKLAVKKTSSGLEYIIHEQGTGAPIQDGDEIQTHYYGVLKSNGKMFDNSFDRGGPAPFPVGGLIPGFNEGMKLLNRGGKATLFIPAALGYGKQAQGEDIPANSDLVFYIEMGQ